MRQLTCTAPGLLEWRDVASPDLSGRAAALIRPLAVARCEIDPLLVRAGPTSPEGFAVGHEAVGEVVQTGPDVSAVAAGQLVFCSFQVSCGLCLPSRDGRTANCAQYPVLSDYGMQPLSGVEYGGMVSDLVRVPHADATLTPVPAGADPVRLASVADNVSDGYRAVAPHLAERPGADVLVICRGSPSIALYAALAAVALGAGAVTFECDSADVLAVAESVGATAVLSAFERRRLAAGPSWWTAGSAPQSCSTPSRRPSPTACCRASRTTPRRRRSHSRWGSFTPGESSSTSGGPTRRLCCRRSPH